METLNRRLRKSGKEWGDQGARLFKDTREAGKHFADFVNHEAKDWGDYLVERSKTLAGEGWAIPGADGILSKIRRGHDETPENEAEAAEASDAEMEERETEVFERAEVSADEAEASTDEEDAQD